MSICPALIMAGLLAQAPAADRPLAVGEVLDRWEAGARKIESYELFAELTEAGRITRVDGVDRILPGAEVPDSAHYYSHVWKQGPKRLGLFWEGPIVRNTMTRSFDGRALITPQSAEEFTIEGGFLSFGMVERDDYETSYRALLGSSDRIAMSKARPSRLLPREGNLYVVDVPKGPPGDFWEFTWKVWIDPDRNFLPVRWTQSIDQQGKPLRDREVAVALKEVVAGVWAPVEMKTTLFNKNPQSAVFGQAMGTSVLKVDLANSKFNIPIPEGRLAIPIPEGATVIDRIRNKIYYQGLDKPHPLDGAVKLKP